MFLITLILQIILFCVLFLTRIRNMNWQFLAKQIYCQCLYTEKSLQIASVGVSLTISWGFQERDQKPEHSQSHKGLMWVKPLIMNLLWYQKYDCDAWDELLKLCSPTFFRIDVIPIFEAYWDWQHWSRSSNGIQQVKSKLELESKYWFYML